jgi:hypothetical protein
MNTSISEINDKLGQITATLSRRTAAFGRINKTLRRIDATVVRMGNNEKVRQKLSLKLVIFVFFPTLLCSLVCNHSGASINNIGLVVLLGLRSRLRFLEMLLLIVIQTRVSLQMLVGSVLLRWRNPRALPISTQ